MTSKRKEIKLEDSGSDEDWYIVDAKSCQEKKAKEIKKKKKTSKTDVKHTKKDKIRSVESRSSHPIELETNSGSSSCTKETNSGSSSCSKIRGIQDTRISCDDLAKKGCDTIKKIDEDEETDFEILTYLVPERFTLLPGRSYNSESKTTTKKKIHCKSKSHSKADQTKKDSPRKVSSETRVKKEKDIIKLLKEACEDNNFINENMNENHFLEDETEIPLMDMGDPNTITAVCEAEAEKKCESEISIANQIMSEGTFPCQSSVTVPSSEGDHEKHISPLKSKKKTSERESSTKSKLKTVICIQNPPKVSVKPRGGNNIKRIPPYDDVDLPSIPTNKPTNQSITAPPVDIIYKQNANDCGDLDTVISALTSVRQINIEIETVNEKIPSSNNITNHNEDMVINRLAENHKPVTDTACRPVPKSVKETKKKDVLKEKHNLGMQSTVAIGSESQKCVDAPSTEELSPQIKKRVKKIKLTNRLYYIPPSDIEGIEASNTIQKNNFVEVTRKSTEDESPDKTKSSGNTFILVDKTKLSFEGEENWRPVPKPNDSSYHTQEQLVFEPSNPEQVELLNFFWRTVPRMYLK